MVKGIRQIRSAAGKRLPDHLLTPIRYTENAFLVTPGSRIAVGSAEVRKERMSRLKALAIHMGAEFREGGPNRYFYEYALLRLAVEFVPGFRTVPVAKPKVGRSRKWDTETQAALIRRVSDVRATMRNPTDFGACKVLEKAGEFQQNSKTSAEALAKRVSEARSIPEAMELALGTRPVR